MVSHEFELFKGCTLVICPQESVISHHVLYLTRVDINISSISLIVSEVLHLEWYPKSEQNSIPAQVTPEICESLQHLEDRTLHREQVSSLLSSPN